MAIKIDILKLLLEKIFDSNVHTFSSSLNQLFNYLKNEIKDNPVYDYYENVEKRTAIIEEWNEMNKRSNNWGLFNEIEKTKILIYNLYKIAGEEGNNYMNICYKLFQIGADLDTSNIYEFNKAFFSYFQDVINEILNANPEIDNIETGTIASKLTFIIHGHDDDFKREVQLLLSRAGVNNIVLHEQPDKGRSIIDKLIEESKPAIYAIALLSEDDTLDSGEKRARQNVIMEIGYFIGKIGKSRIRIILKGDNIEIPSDLQGILYERYDKQGSWKIKLLKEMLAVGIYVDLQSVINTI